jgi:hypothetical protein
MMFEPIQRTVFALWFCHLTEVKPCEPCGQDDPLGCFSYLAYKIKPKPKTMQLSVKTHQMSSFGTDMPPTTVPRAMKRLRAM